MQIVSLWIGKRVSIGDSYQCEGKMWKISRIISEHEIQLHLA